MFNFSREFCDVERRIHRRNPRSPFTTVLSIWSVSTSRDTNHSISSTYRPSPIRVIYNWAWWFRPHRNQRGYHDPRLRLHNSRFPPELSLSLWCPCPILF